MSDRHPGVLLSLVMRLTAGRMARLKALSKRTRVRQSEYLREAIDDLLKKHSTMTADECKAEEAGLPE